MTVDNWLPFGKQNKKFKFAFIYLFNIFRSVPFEARVEQVLSWLDLPAEERALIHIFILQRNPTQQVMQKVHLEIWFVVLLFMCVVNILRKVKDSGSSFCVPATIFIEKLHINNT